MRQALGTDGRGTSDGVAARGFVNGRDPRLRRGRDSTDRCVPARSPSAADHERACLLQSQKKSKGPKSPTQRSGALNYPCFYKIKVSKTGRYVLFSKSQNIFFTFMHFFTRGHFSPESFLANFVRLFINVGKKVVYLPPIRKHFLQ